MLDTPTTIYSYLEFSFQGQHENKLVFMEYDDGHGPVVIVAEFLKMKNTDGLAPISEAGGIESVQRVQNIRDTKVVSPEDFQFFQEHGTIYYGITSAKLLGYVKSNGVCAYLDPHEVEGDYEVKETFIDKCMTYIVMSFVVGILAYLIIELFRWLKTMFTQ